MEDVLRAANLQMQDLFLDYPQQAKTPEASHKLITETVMLQGSQGHWNYTDEEGAVLYRTVRYHQGSGKRFMAYRPNGNGQWIPNISGVRRVLYRLPELIETDPSKPVFVVEGEKHVDRLRSLGLTAACNPFGAGKWRSEYCESLRDRNVVILPDNDGPGLKHGDQVAELLQGIACSIKVLVLPRLPPKGDIIDWLDAGHDKAELLQGVRTTQDTPNAIAESAPEERRVLHLADMSNAECLVQLYGRDLRYCFPFSDWLVWDGTQWNLDKEGELVNRAKAGALCVLSMRRQATGSKNAQEGYGN